MSVALRAAGGVALLALAACSSGRDLVEMTSPTTVRVAGEPLGPILVRLKADARPPEERGTRRFMGTSFVGGNALREPADVSLLRVLARDLVAAGVATKASLVADEQPYLLDVTIEHLAASYREGIETVATAVLPTSPIQADCAVKLSLLDRSGRQFLDQSFTEQVRRGGAWLTGLESDAKGAWTAAIRGAVDAALPEIHASVSRFWSKLGVSPPR